MSGYPTRTYVVITSTRQTVDWRLPWRARLRAAIAILLGWPFIVEGDFTITHEVKPGATEVAR